MKDCVQGTCLIETNFSCLAKSFSPNNYGNPDSHQAFLNKNVHHLVPHVIILTSVNVGKFASPNLTPMDFVASKIGMKTRYMITENFPFLFPHMAS